MDNNTPEMNVQNTEEAVEKKTKKKKRGKLPRKPVILSKKCTEL